MEQNEDIEFKELTEEEIEVANEYSNKAYKAYEEKKYDEALELLEKVPAEFPGSLYIKGCISFDEEKYKNAISYFEVVLNKMDEIEINSSSQSILNYIYFCLALSYYATNETNKSAIFFCKYNTPLIRVAGSLHWGHNMNNIAKEMLNLNADALFSKTVARDNRYLEYYQNIYIKSLEIVASLYVEREEETTEVAHYTSKTVVGRLLADKSPFRLSTVANANDPQEGKPLLKHLEIEENCISEDYQAFVGSFIFNPDSLNQFRLYGKENGAEATGVSIVFNKEYFNKQININPSLSGIRQTIGDLDASEVEDESKKQALFRCIYLDPDTEQVISVGHKEEYTFLREKYKEKGKIYKKTINDYKKYKKYIDDLIDDLRGSLGDLKNEIEDLLGKAKNESEKQEMRRTVCELLIHLRYLVKHVAFKEEQECRLIRVEPLEGNSEIQYQDNRMFIDYLPVTEYVTDIYFGPKAQGINLFRDMLKLKGIRNVQCHQSDHPFFV